MNHKPDETLEDLNPDLLAHVTGGANIGSMLGGLGQMFGGKGGGLGGIGSMFSSMLGGKGGGMLDKIKGLFGGLMGGGGGGGDGGGGDAAAGG